MMGLAATATATAMVWSAGASAKPVRSGPVRSVELITMTAPAPEPEPDVSGDGTAGVRSPDTGPLSSRFRVHDLGRQWVTFRMANSLANAGTAAGQWAAESAGHAQGAPIIDTGAILPPEPRIPVPLWMQTGSSFASAAIRYEPTCAALAYRPTGFLRADAEGRRASYYQLMSSIACEHGIPVGLFDAMIIRESRYRTDALSPKNAFGLTQLMPGTAAQLGVNRYSVEGNLRGGAKYLRQQLDTFGHYHLALAAYNAGPGRVRGGRVPRIAETQAYVGNVLADWARLSGVYRQAILLPSGNTAGQSESIRPERRSRVTLF
jgi:soluble lytic murein transglycosylase-like protein